MSGWDVLVKGVFCPPLVWPFGGSCFGGGVCLAQPHPHSSFPISSRSIIPSPTADPILTPPHRDPSSQLSHPVLFLPACLSSLRFISLLLKQLSTTARSILLYSVRSPGTQGWRSRGFEARAVNWRIEVSAEEDISYSFHFLPSLTVPFNLFAAVSANLRIVR